RLAEVFTVVSSVAVLSEVSGSNTPEVVLAVERKSTRLNYSHLSTTYTVFCAQHMIVVRFHPTTPAVRVPPPVAETKLVPAGIASASLTPVASDGPLFVILSVLVLLVPGCTVFPYSTLFRSRLAEVFTVVSSVAVLSEVSGSNTPEVVLA